MEPQIILIILVAFGVGLLLGWLLGRFSGGRALAVLVGLLALAILWMVVMARQAQGWDGIGYAIGAFLLASPATLGVLLGGWAGLRQRRRRLRGQA